MKTMRIVGAYTDQELVRGCQKNKPKFQKALYKKYHQRMYGIALRYANSRPDADDIMQDSFITVFKKIDMFRGEAPLETWIRQIIINTALSAYRKQSKFITVLEEEAYEKPTLDANALSSMEKKDLLKLIQALPTVHRTVLNMNIIEGYSHKEIANKLGITESTSRVYLFKAKQILKDKISQLKLGYHVG